MRLYIEGHHPQKGYAITREWSDQECSTLRIATDEELKPVRFVAVKGKAMTLVSKWNRRFATH